MSTTTESVQAAAEKPASQAVVAAVAEETDTDPMELEPLYAVVDPDALDALLDAGESGPGAASTRVEFTYAGCEVCVRAGGAVEVAVVED